MVDIGQIGVVFDLDGVLIDSHDQHHAAWIRLAGEIGEEITPDQFARSFGMRNEMCIPHVFGWAEPEDRERIVELGDRKEEHYRDILAEESIDSLPGVAGFVEQLRQNGIPGSVGSSTSVINIRLCIEAIGLGDFFGDCLTGAEDVARGKPAPDVFLEAAAKMNRFPRHCVVIEDAHVGVEAGRAAGMKVIAVTTTHPAASFEGPDLIVDRLDEVGIGDLVSLFGK